MHFLITTLKVVYVLSTLASKFVENETLKQTRKRCKWDNDDYICLGHILNSMSDALFDVYQNVESAKELWDQLEAKYMAEYTSSKKFLVSNFNNYRMVDSRSVLLRIPGQYTQHGLQTHVIKDKDELSLIQLGNHFRIEETLRMEESGKGKGKDIVGSSSVNMVEDDKNKKNKKTPRETKGNFMIKRMIPTKRIIHQTTAPYTPQQNGVSERKNRALKEMVNSMLSYSGLSEGFWGEAMLTACYLLNRVPNKNNKITPYELWYKKRPNLSYLRVWGCRAVVRLPEPKKKNLGEKGIDCIFIGYAEHSKAYRFYVIEPNDSVSVNSVIESRDAIFDENRFSSIPRPKDIVSSSNGTQGGDLPGETPIEIPEPRRSNRARVAKSYGSDFQLYLVEGSRDEIASQYSYCYSIEEDPKTFDEAMKSRDVAFWKEAVDDEIGSIMENNTWVLSDLPPGCKPLGCKWIFKRKMKVDGTIDKFKARLVIQGFRQKEGIDYFDTYAPVARISTIRLLIALAATHNLVM
ncbi:zinc finger, CCHC-type containing protein [Tanacetum coccineum]